MIDSHFKPLLFERSFWAWANLSLGFLNLFLAYTNIGTNPYASILGAGVFGFTVGLWITNGQYIRISNIANDSIKLNANMIKTLKSYKKSKRKY